jgi:GNAT superfamily N-acetyltransferase
MERSTVRVRIRRFLESDKEKTLVFLKRIFAGWRSESQWKWKFRQVEKAQNRRTIMWIAEDDGEIVGHLAAFPMELRVAGDVFPVCQLVDGALDPKYRHMGIYRNIVEKALLDAKAQGNAVTFGFANRPSYRVYARGGRLQKVCEITQMFKVFSLVNAAKTVKAHSLHDGEDAYENNGQLKDFFVTLKERAISTFFQLLLKLIVSLVSNCVVSKHAKMFVKLREAEATELAVRLEKQWAKLSNSYRYAFERDRKFLEWRYSNPEAEYRVYVAEKADDIVGYFVVACEEKSLSIGKLTMEGFRVGHIVDLVAEPNLMSALISAAEEELEKQHVCFINCWTTEGSPLFKELRKMCYHELPKEMYKITMVASVGASNLKTIFSSEPKNILISLGDSDLV